MPRKHYIMRDQVRDLVPSLMSSPKPGTVARIREWLQIGVFGLAVLSYITALSLSA